MNKWKEYKLSDIVEFSGGSQPPKSNFSDTCKEGYVRLIQIRDYKSDSHKVYVDKEKTKKFCSKDDVMIGRYGPPVFQILRGLEGAYNVALMKAIPDESILSKDFLFYFLDNPSIQDYIISLSQRSAGQSGVNKKALEDYPILVPSLQNQKHLVNRIVSLFENVDKAIKLLEENIENSRALMGSILNRIYMSNGVSLKDACVIGPKKSEISHLESDIEVSFLPMKDLNEHNINFRPQEVKQLSEVYKGYTYFAEGDVILAKVTPCFENGKAGLATNLVNGIGFGSSEYYVLRPKEGVLAEWIYFALLSEQFRVTGKENMTGSGGLQRVPKKFLEDWKIPLPDLKVQRKEVDRIRKIQMHTTSLQKETEIKITSLKALKKSILDKVFKGQLI
ncbi:type I restriction enzyme, S subunit [Salinimicrobium catena]|uniref:Type I restriction enzyme, S subunit n=1 Tax=Salinimicrobium catena TaxID=390640 RepID=A0A1H5N417_9FLAO|nr:restriction endonuclease subunit S [Salinimicrobium catena]SDL36406.1 type I restriction enzyme, S subunit [Salinimicrobium catena]SEE96322.1 type I restriction enzyme, S subunit [Salinimicrobium catena]